MSATRLSGLKSGPKGQYSEGHSGAALYPYGNLNEVDIDSRKRKGGGKEQVKGKRSEVG